VLTGRSFSIIIVISITDSPRTMFRMTIAHNTRHRISFASLFKRLAIDPFDTYYDRRLL
jgi:hypothetical protein